MKTLLLLRHAKAEADGPAGTDESRRLTHRGERDAKAVGAWLRDQALVPDMVISSSAARARQTAELSAESGGLPTPIDFRPELYLAPPAAYVDILKTRGDDQAAVMMVGHNPGIEELATLLSGSDQSMGTAAVAHFRFAIRSWSELRLGTRGELIDLWRPKDDA